jgi:hypothetical protein
MGRNQTKSTSLLPTVTSAPLSASPSLPESLPRSSHSSLAILCCLRDESRRSGGETVVSGHRLPPLLPVSPFVTLRRQRATNVTTPPAARAHAARAIPGTGDRRRPRHGHATTTTWTPPLLASWPIKTCPEHTTLLAPLPSPS